MNSDNLGCFSVTCARLKHSASTNSFSSNWRELTGPLYIEPPLLCRSATAPAKKGSKTFRTSMGISENIQPHLQTEAHEPLRWALRLSGSTRKHHRSDNHISSNVTAVCSYRVISRWRPLTWLSYKA